MLVYQACLSLNHKRMLFVESAVSPEVVAERGYRTVSRFEVPKEFKDYQRRPGLLIPTRSPDRVTTRVRLRPDRPRKGKDGKPRKYEQPTGAGCILDVHPRNLEAVKDPNEDLLITEGEKKADSLTSHGLCAIGLAGVWNWQRDGEPLPCWDHVALEGRRVFVVFDADVMEKENVQLALERLVAMLEQRGADVRVVYLPGPDKGVDDYLAAGGTVNELKMLARKFEPQDIGRIRLSRDEKLRAAMEDLRSLWWGEPWNRMVGAGEKPHWMRGFTARDVKHALLDFAARRGKLVEDGIALTVSARTLALESKKGKPAVLKALDNLQADGWLRIETPDDPKKPRTYVLFTGRAIRYHKGSEVGEEGGETQELQRCNPRGNTLRASLGCPAVPRLRWSSPGRKPRKVLLRQKPRKVWGAVEGVESVKRLGPRRGAVIDRLEASGSWASEAEIAEFLGCKRVRDVRRRVLAPLEELGILVIEGDTASLTDDWRERLEEERKDKGEVEAEKNDRNRFAEERRQYRENGPPPPAEEVPTLMGKERFAKIVEEREKEDTERRLEEQRRKVGVTAETFVHDKLKALGRIRLALLREIYHEEGGNPSHVLPAAVRLGCRVERLPEHENHQFIFAPTEWEAA